MRIFIKYILISALIYSQLQPVLYTEEATEENPPQEEEGVQQEETAINLALAETPGTLVPGEVDFTKRVSLDLRDMEVTDILKYISLKSGANLVISKMVTGRVTFQLKNVPLKDLLDVILLSNGLAYEKQGEIYYVMTDKEYSDRYGQSFSDVRTIKLVRLNYAIPSKAFELLDTLKSSVGRLLVDQETGTVLIMDSPEKIKKMEDALLTLEEKSNVTVFNLKYAKAKEVEEQLKKQLDDKNVGSISADERSNQVIVQTLPERMAAMMELITALDKKTKEVLIEARIIQIQISDEMTAGFEWEGLFTFLQNTLFREGFSYLGSNVLHSVLRKQETTVDEFKEMDITITPGGEELNQPAAGTFVKPGSKKTLSEEVFFGIVGENENKGVRFSLETVLKYLQTLGDVKFISSPKLAVVNNQEARIHIGRREAYITTTTTAGQATTTIAEEVSFVDTGIQLSVTPAINDDGFVTMKIKPEVSRVVDTLITPSNNKIPIIDTSTAETTVMAKDGSTIIIGGLRGESQQKGSKQIPFLGSIPILGSLFSSRTKRTIRNELVVMITPTIVTGETLVTGSRVELGEQESKPYRDYDVFEPYKENGDEDVKPFRDYGIVKDVEEPGYAAPPPFKSYRDKY